MALSVILIRAHKYTTNECINIHRMYKAIFRIVFLLRVYEKSFVSVLGADAHTECVALMSKK